ncbi:hypothetical protein Tco_0400098 [Tanacetum coccineum]
MIRSSIKGEPISSFMSFIVVPKGFLRPFESFPSIIQSFISCYLSYFNPCVGLLHQTFVSRGKTQNLQGVVCVSGGEGPSTLAFYLLDVVYRQMYLCELLLLTKVLRALPIFACGWPLRKGASSYRDLPFHRKSRCEKAFLIRPGEDNPQSSGRRESQNPLDLSGVHTLLAGDGRRFPQKRGYHSEPEEGNSEVARWRCPQVVPRMAPLIVKIWTRSGFDGDRRVVEDIETIENVIKDESHFVTKIIDNDLGVKVGGGGDSNDGRGRGGFVVLGGRSSRESKSAFGAGGGEVSGGGDDFGVTKSSLGEILGVVIGERGGKTFGEDGGAIWQSIGGDRTCSPGENIFGFGGGNGQGGLLLGEPRCKATSYECAHTAYAFMVDIVSHIIGVGVKIDNPNITMEEYIRLEEETAHRRVKVYNWKTVTYGKIRCNEGVHDLGSVETEFLAIVFNDKLTSEVALSCEPTVSPLNDNQIDFRISFDESDNEDYTVIYDKNSFSYKIIYVDDLKTDSENNNDKVNIPLFPSSEPTISYFDDFNYFKDFEKEFPAIVYNDALTSKLDFSPEPTVSPQHINEFDETSLSECDDVGQNIIYFNDMFPFNVIYPNDLSDKDKDNDKIYIEHSSGDLSIEPLPNVKGSFQPERLAWVCAMITYLEEGLEVGSIRRIQGIGYGVLEFLGVGTTFYILQNLHILYLKYDVLVFSGYGVLSLFPLWSLVSAGTDMPYLP